MGLHIYAALDNLLPMKVGVVGGSGYAGGELLRLLAGHPIFEVETISAHSNAGLPVTAIHPQLQSYTDIAFQSHSPENFTSCDVVFLALPHGESAGFVKELPDQTKIVDLGADFRLESATAWQKYYGGDHAGTWVYGLPELFRSSIFGQSRIANPGCYATAIALGASPAADFADLSDIVVVAASGTTGAGRSAKVNLLASEVMGTLTSYKFGGVHQHTPEIEQSVLHATGQPTRISFTPILAPQPRGILATLSMKTSASEREIRAVYQKAYGDEAFVSLLPEGSLPKTSSVTGTNMAQIQIAVDSHTSRLTVSVAIDNLGKGAAGQAIQNANIIAGVPEITGLVSDGIGA